MALIKRTHINTCQRVDLMVVKRGTSYSAGLVAGALTLELSPETTSLNVKTITDS